MNKLSHHLNPDELKRNIDRLGILLLDHPCFVFDGSCSIAIHKVVPPFLAVCAELVISCDHNFTNDEEPWFMSSQPEHDQICISTVNAVGLIWRVPL